MRRSFLPAKARVGCFRLVRLLGGTAERRYEIGIVKS